MMTNQAASPIVLMTDFGTQDTYVGVMKGVIAEIAPAAPIIDLTHAIPQGDLRQAAYKLWQSVGYFPEGTIFVVVVDPGVGTQRKAVGVQWGGYSFIAPDNGLLSYLLALDPAKAAFELANPDFHHHPVSSTFHGRDIFAPAGGHLAAGHALEEFGEHVPELVRIELPTMAHEQDGRLVGEVVYLDGFGNAITSLGRLEQTTEGLALDPWLNQFERRQLPPADKIHLPEGRQLPLSSTFGEVPLGEPVAYLGSEQMLEIAINGGSAAEQLNLQVGAPITITFRGKP